MRGFRVGVVNPRTPFGARIRELLSEQHLPVIELKLFESEPGGEATLTQFQDDIIVTQPLDADLFPHLDVLFFGGEDRDLWNRLAVEAGSEGVLTLVEGSIGLDAPMVDDASTATDERVFIVPRMASYLVGTTLKRIGASLPIARASATVLVPAGERGDAGADELHQQVVNLLNFKSLPRDVFDEQVAFNVNVVGRGAGALALAETVAMEASRLAQLEDALTVSLVRVPVFHGYAASLWVELESPAEQRAIVSCFREPPFAIDTGRGAGTASPVSVAQSNRIHAGGIRRPSEVSRPGFWVWIVADTTAYDPGLAAVEMVKRTL